MARMKYEANGITIEISHGSCVGFCECRITVPQMFLNWWTARPRHPLCENAPNAACVWMYASKSHHP